MALTKLLATFKATPTLANAKALVAYTTHASNKALRVMTAEDMATETQAKRIIADAKDPKKTKEAMQRELQARFKGMNITVI